MADTSGPDRAAMRAVAASLGNRANALAAEGRAAEVPALWEDAIAELPDAGSRALTVLAYAWYQALHGEVEHGVRLAAGLRDCPVASVRGQVRVLVRSRARFEPSEVEHTWRAATGTLLPAWAFLAEGDIDRVAKWVSAASWEESKTLYDAQIIKIPPQDVDDVLEEVVLGDARLRSTVAVHRALLALGGETGFRAVSDAKEAARAAGAAIATRDWDALRACATIELTVHGRAFLGGVHGVAAELMIAGDAEVSPAMAERVGALARDARPGEREQVAADLAAIGDPRLPALLAAAPPIP